MEQFPTLGMGTGTSPVLYQNLVIIQRDEDNGERSAIVAYDKRTGKEAWRAKRNVQITWATPVLVDTGRRVELVTNATEFVIAYDPASGKELWRSRGVESNAIHTPLVGARPGDRDRRLSREEGHRAAARATSPRRSASPGNTPRAPAT